MSSYSYQLEIEKYKDQIINIINKNKITIIKGPTGCGKSTYIPLLYKDKKVAIIEPRRIAVKSIHRILSKTVPYVGYKMRFDKKISLESKMVIYTDGSFLHEINMFDFDYIIIDEVHERTERMDLIMGFLREKYSNKLILMSASLETKSLEQFFKAAVFEVPGKSHSVELNYLDRPTNDYIFESYFTISKILQRKDRKMQQKDVLVFLTGEEDIEELYELCRKLPSIGVHKMHSGINEQEQMRIFETTAWTKVILSTNICEASLTIPGVGYVVDCGLSKIRIFDGIARLGIQKISRESSLQRMGRCNRLGPGVCYRLYTEYEIFSKQSLSIQRSDLSGIVLSLLNAGKNVFKFEFVDYPSIPNYIDAILFLLSKLCVEIKFKNNKSNNSTDNDKSVKKLTESNNKNLNLEDYLKKIENGEFIDYTEIIDYIDLKITNYGLKIAKHPFEPVLAHFYEKCIQARIGYHASAFLSIVSQESFGFFNAAGNKTKLADILFYRNLFIDYLKTENKQHFCNISKVSYKVMQTAHRIFKTLNKSNDGDENNFEKLFSSCFNHNLCDRLENGTYIMRRNNTEIFIHPSSIFFNRKDKKIIVLDVFCTSKIYARIVGKYYT